ncbi:MAG: hypothetical protein R3Y54_01560 [Eubacteriales bacterium]
MVYEKRYKASLAWASLFALTVIPSILFPSIYSDFMASFFPRFVFLGATVSMLTANDGTSKMIAGLLLSGGAIIVLLGVIIAAFVGGFLGSRIVKKHFSTMEDVS